MARIVSLLLTFAHLWVVFRLAASETDELRKRFTSKCDELCAQSGDNGGSVSVLVKAEQKINISVEVNNAMGRQEMFELFFSLALQIPANGEVGRVRPWMSIFQYRISDKRPEQRQSRRSESIGHPLRRL